MGLDMFAMRVSKENAVGDFEIARDSDGHSVDTEEIHYWRKHHDLHGWMEKLYRKKGGDAASFNCIPVRLTVEDLDALQTDLLNSALPHTTGFFFGNNPPDLESLRGDLAFLQKARDVLAEGDEVYYNSWW